MITTVNRVSFGEHKVCVFFVFISHVRVVRAGLFAVPLRLPAAVAVDELRQIGRLLGVPRDELVLEELFGCWPLCNAQQTGGQFGEDIVRLGKFNVRRLSSNRFIRLNSHICLSTSGSGFS